MKHIPRKRFGQNFLTDQSVLHDIIRAIDPKPQDAMVEIGPGLGAMTALLLEGLERLHVVELDRDLAAYLAKRFDRARLQVHSGDALQYDFGALADAAGGKLRVVGNLPYNISSPLLFHLAAFAPKVQDQHFMLQKEVVERMVAEPGGKDYGRLSVMLQWRYRMALLFTVPPAAFDPPPRVESAIVRMVPLEAPLPCVPERLAAVVQKAFSQRRKVLRNCLAGMFTPDQLLEAGVDPQARPETVGVEQYVALANRLAPEPGEGPPPALSGA
ncbi:MAG: 16S rRNA (adenine(1518)-N(6)/adenine(1519)-N(6))-dimethyltransferase RsmA [Noviherbaspirillum sp.]